MLFQTMKLAELIERQRARTHTHSKSMNNMPVKASLFWTTGVGQPSRALHTTPINSTAFRNMHYIPKMIPLWSYLSEGMGVNLNNAHICHEGKTEANLEGWIRKPLLLTSPIPPSLLPYPSLCPSSDLTCQFMTSEVYLGHTPIHNIHLDGSN